MTRKISGSYPHSKSNVFHTPGASSYQSSRWTNFHNAAESNFGVVSSFKKIQETMRIARRPFANLYRKPLHTHALTHHMSYLAPYLAYCCPPPADTHTYSYLSLPFHFASRLLFTVSANREKVFSTIASGIALRSKNASPAGSRTMTQFFGSQFEACACPGLTKCESGASKSMVATTATPNRY